MELQKLEENGGSTHHGAVDPQHVVTEQRASTRAIIITLLKVCVGTGVLAVPRSFARGGVATMALTLVVLVLWNEWCARRLLECRSLLTPRERVAVAKADGE